LVNNWHKPWLDQVVAHSFGTWSALKVKSHWDFLWLVVSKYWLGIDTVLYCTGILLLQLFRVCFEDLIWDLILAFLLCFFSRPFRGKQRATHQSGSWRLLGNWRACFGAHVRHTSLLLRFRLDFDRFSFDQILLMSVTRRSLTSRPLARGIVVHVLSHLSSHLLHPPWG
jgi:hypothetical protein